MYSRKRNQYFMDAYSKGVSVAGYARAAYDLLYPNKKQKMAPIPVHQERMIDRNVGGNVPGMSQTAIMKFRVNPPLRRTLKGSVEYRDYYNYEIAWQAGTKKFTALCNIGTRDQYLSNANNPNQGPFSSQNWFSLQPNQAQQDGSYVSTNFAPLADWIGISGMDTRFDFINLSTLPCWCRLTWYRCVEDSNVTAMQAFRDSEQNNKLFDTDFTVSGTTVTLPDIGGNAVRLDYGAASISSPENMTTMPYINLSSRKQVKLKWKPLKSHTWTMSGGSTFKLATLAAVNCFQNRQSVTDSEDPYFKGSIVAILECQGMATHLKIPAVPGDGQVAIDEPSLAAGKLGVVISRHLNIKAMSPTVNRWDSTYIGVGSLSVRGSVLQAEVIEDAQMVVGAGAVAT